MIEIPWYWQAHCGHPARQRITTSIGERVFAGAPCFRLITTEFPNEASGFPGSSSGGDFVDSSLTGPNSPDGKSVPGFDAYGLYRYFQLERRKRDCLSAAGGHVAE